MDKTSELLQTMLQATLSGKVVWACESEGATTECTAQVGDMDLMLQQDRAATPGGIATHRVDVRLPNGDAAGARLSHEDAVWASVIIGAALKLMPARVELQAHHDAVFACAMQLIYDETGEADSGD